MRIAIDTPKEAPVGEVLEAAATLAKAIRAAAEWQALERAQAAFQRDAVLQQKLARHDELSKARQLARESGQNWAGREMVELIALQDQIQRHERYVQRQEAGQALVELLQNINQAISDNLGLDFASNAALRRGGCCG
ncbi:MAG: hypothetical protein ABS95_00415 [Verrucomicrobia bacterium SCN 57-15]|nr:MAG: hypothetical protein ABS95_00415 [Verrucomicrobia bacterium SCN 57-15]